MLTHLDKARPPAHTICVLAHVKTQWDVSRRSVEVDLPDCRDRKTNLTEFDISVDLLDHAWRTMSGDKAIPPQPGTSCISKRARRSTRTEAQDRHDDLRGRVLRPSRRYCPFMVNNVTGFIGPKRTSTTSMIISNLRTISWASCSAPYGHGPPLHAAFANYADGQQMATASGPAAQLLHGCVPQQRPHARLLDTKRPTISAARDTRPHADSRVFVQRWNGNLQKTDAGSVVRTELGQSGIFVRERAELKSCALLPRCTDSRTPARGR